MEHHSAPPPVSPQRHWPLFLIGVICFVLGPVIYTFQFRGGSLVVPWHWPALAAIGVLCMVTSACQRPSLWRIGGAVVFALLCGLEWYYFSVVTSVPAYTGPAQVGNKLPAFTATYADGRAFTNKDLEDGSRSVLVFFRGRW